MATLDPVDFQEYVFGSVDDRERLSLQHQIFEANFITNLNHLLDDFGLAQKLEAAKQSGQKVWILDAGCGEGLYLQTVATILQQRGLLEAANLVGVDKDGLAIILANELKAFSNPPHPSLQYYSHDITRPFAENLALKDVKFDCIFEVAVLPYLPNFCEVVKGWYDHLQTGGVMYFRDFTTNEVETGWITYSPLLTPFFRHFIEFVTSVNRGLDVSRELPKCLTEYGAAKVETLAESIPINSTSKIGLEMLRNMVMMVRNSGPVLVKHGFLSQIDFEAVWQQMLVEINQDTITETTLINTLIQKP